MRKILSLMVIGLMLSFMPVMAISLTPGETIQSDMISEDVAPSENRGGILTQVGTIYERFVNYLGTKIWSDSSENLATDFDLYAFPEGSPQPNFETMQVNEIFEVSEEVIVRGVNGIWTTNRVVFNSAPDFQVIANEGDRMQFDSGEVAIVIDSDWITATWLREGTLNGEAYTFDFSIDCDGLVAVCGWEANAEDFFGELLGADGWRVANTPYGNVMAFNTDLGEWKFVVDKDASGLFEFVGSEINGFKTSSISTQALLIVDTIEMPNADLYYVL